MCGDREEGCALVAASILCQPAAEAGLVRTYCNLCPLAKHLSSRQYIYIVRIHRIIIVYILVLHIITIAIMKYNTLLC